MREKKLIRCDRKSRFGQSRSRVESTVVVLYKALKQTDDHKSRRTGRDLPTTMARKDPKNYEMSQRAATS